jgi:hypothetical protein
MNQDEMLAELMHLIRAQEEEGPAGITTAEIAAAQGRRRISYSFRQDLNALVAAGFMVVYRGNRKICLGEITHPPVYAFTNKGKELLEQTAN